MTPPGDDARERSRGWADGETETAASAGATASGMTQPFVVIRNGDAVTTLDLAADREWMIGRGRDADVVIDDKRVSRHHAKLRVSKGLLSIEDLGSRNGTMVAGTPLRASAARIGVGDVVEIGPCQIVVAARAAGAHARGLAGVAGAENEQDGDLVVGDAEMARVYASARKVAPMPTTVLVLGETGTGKDVLAQRIHAWSARASGPFVRVNCAGIPDTLLESELFGHERGAFTGADRRRSGYFEAASGGTIFLDEIGELSATAQVKLLSVLENRAVVRLGSTLSIPVDVRVICATHRDLQDFVRRERFRADLYFRISTMVMRVPPLRSRKTEIPILANHFLRRFTAQVGRPLVGGIAPDAMAMLEAYGWPGNVRELKNAIERAVAMAEGVTLCRRDFGPEVDPSDVLARKRPRPKLADVERREIEEALAAEGGNQTRAAERLGMPRRTLVYKIAKYRRTSTSDDPDEE